jgi:dTMP kinase
MKPSLFVAIEGIDGSGKTTQCQKVRDRLQSFGLPVKVCADPGGTELGMRLRDLLLNFHGHIEPVTETLLFMASRAELVAKVIQPSLAEGNIVLSDRYLLSNVAYQGYGGEVGPDAVWEAGLVAVGDVVPDLTIILDLTVEKALSRRKAKPDRVEERPTQFHKAVREGFLVEARRQPDKMKVLDATLPIEEVTNQIYQLIIDRILAKYGPSGLVSAAPH